MAVTELSSSAAFVTAFESMTVTWSAGDDESGIVEQQLCVHVCIARSCVHPIPDAAFTSGAALSACFNVTASASSFVLPSLNDTLAEAGQQADVMRSGVDSSTYVVVIGATNAAALMATSASEVYSAVWAVRTWAGGGTRCHAVTHTSSRTDCGLRVLGASLGFSVTGLVRRGLTLP